MDGDNMYGFTYGSDVGENIFSVHIEKADRTVTGAYPALASRFVQDASGTFYSD